MNDYELVCKKDYFGLWKKYEGLMMIYFKKLPEDVRDYLFEDFKDFKDSCYQILINAVDALTLSKIHNKDTWTFWQQFSFYLQNYTTRQCVRDTYNIWNNERSTDIFNSLGDNTSEYNTDFAYDDHKDLDVLYNNIKDSYKKAIELRLRGANWETVRENLGMNTGQFRTFKKELRDEVNKYI